MLVIWSVGLFFLGAVKGEKVCYNRIGCFSDDKPWTGTKERPRVNLPWTPEKINTRFLLYTRSNQDSFQVISAIIPFTITSSHFCAGRKTRIVIHGFTSSGEDVWVTKMCKVLLEVEDINCIAVDWSDGSHTDYPQAANNARVVGAEVAYFVEFLSKNVSHPLSNVHLIGHSLGAHAAGEAGKRKPGISRITGFGMSQLSGHLDFFPNGGVTMPGCPEKKEIPNANIEDITTGVIKIAACNHVQAIKYYTDSIFSSCIFTSYPCSNYSTYQLGGCETCPSAGCPKMGHFADTYRGVTSASQVFYLNTP
ncbi:inactive pancreatic lipase-related protein 1-like isoform X2 [Ascaphus truei]|uniref:inactive pancreatic lipase-related protein 1-like isoform X2 n=1 Tax=Ascaphus truei TaxID=8439 RepID=UPI003F5AC064